MKITCPSCSATHSLDGLLSDADARATMLIAAQLPADLGPQCVRYLGLFRPGQRSLSWPRARKLLQELAELIRAGSVRRRGRDWPVPSGAWHAAFQTMLDKRDSLDLPLKSHGYLLEIVAGAADKAEAQAERVVEGERRAGRHAPSAEDLAEQTASHHRNVRTAVSLVVNEATIARTRFRESYTADQAQQFLEGRGYAADVVSAAISQWQAAGK